MPLTGKTIVVTGAASGIGAATAALVKSQGATVIAVDRNKPSETYDRFEQVDLMDKAAIDDLIARLIPLKIDGLANIAGLPPTRPAADVVAVNLVALKHLTLSLVDSMADGASIVNLASLAGFGWENEVPKILASEGLDFDGVAAFCDANDITKENSYFFAKQALVAWTIANRWTWRDRGIRMNAVSPGPVDTPILGDFLETLGERAEEDMRIMDRPGNADDIAPVVAFLLSDAAGWLRGANLPVDGGMKSHILANESGLEKGE
ncbi:MAG: 3-alpha-hydroxysteroid dehydrogenase [Rhodobacteraceae bacterium]|nr:MAG: 3-alpha-hydroxysteroid dehydrogenase [Paracoccaceae bacterium]